MVEAGGDVRIVRLPPSVHGAGDHGFVSMLAAIARAKGASAYVENAGNSWPAVNRWDAASLFGRVAESGQSGGTYHAVGEEKVSFRDIAAAIGKALGVPAIGLSQDAAPEHFGAFFHFAMMDLIASSEVTQRSLGWEPTHIDLIAEISDAGYF